MAADSGKQRVGALAADHFFGERDAERLNVSPVGQIRIGHDGGRIGIDQHHFVAVGAERLAGLRAGVVEFAGLPDDDGAGADDQDAVKVVAARHLRTPLQLLHQCHEVVEQVMRIVRPRRCFRMILDAEHRLAAMAEAFQRLVVQIDVGQLHFALS